MADEIRQDLGFDAAQALETINKLNAGFDSLFQTLSASPRAFDSFNQRGQQTLDTLIKIQAQVKSTTAALSSVGGVNPNAANAGAGANAGAQAAAAQQLTQTINAATAASNQLGQATTQTGNASTNALKQSTRAAGGFALSLETITRVLGTQLIVRSLGAIQRGIEESFGDFIKLQNGLATLRTISTDSIGSLEKELVGLSNSFNVPLLEVVQAKYEILQNGFESTSESVDILTASLKFARVANTDAAQSADLVSSSLNAYGQAASEAETLTAKLVETIQLGRIKGSELVSALGRVSPIAKELGVSMDEVLAAFSSITIGATRTSEAATQVRSTLASLLKPSDDMKVAFKKLGVETGDQAIQTFGFKGALEALIGTTNGSTHAIAALFPNFRALTGVLREAGSGSEVFDRHLKDIQQTANAVLNKKFQIRIDSDAEKVTADFNKFSNFLTTEVGKSLVQTTSQAISLVGGIDNLIAAARGLAPTLGFASVALVAYATVAGLAAAKNNLFTTSLKDANAGVKLFGGALGVVTAIFGAIQASESFDQFVLASVNSGRKKLEEEGRQILADQREKDGARLELAKAAQQAQQQQLNLQIAQTQKAYSEQLDIAKVANEELVNNNKSAMDRIIEARERFATDLKRAAQKAEEQAKDSFLTSQKEIIKLVDERFNRQQKQTSALNQSQNANQRAEALFNQAQNQLLKAKTDEEIKLAHSTFDRAEGFRQQAIEANKTAGIMQSQFEINRQLDKDAQRRIDSELRFQKIREADAQKLRQQAAEEERRNDKLKVLAKEFLDKSKLFDAQGNRLPAEKIASNIKDANAALSKFQELALGKGSKANVTDLLSFDGLQRRLEEKIGAVDIKQLETAPSALDNVNKKIQGSLDNAKFIIKITADLGIDQKQFQGLNEPDALNAARSAIKDHGEEVTKLNENLAHRLDLERQIARAQQEGQASVEKGESVNEGRFKQFKRLQEIFALNLTGKPEEQTSANVGIEQDRINGLRGLIKTGLNDPNLSKEFIQNLATKLTDFSEHASISFKIDIDKAQTEFERLVDVFKKRQEVKKLIDAGVTPENLDKARAGQAKAADDVLQESNRQKLIDKGAQAATSAATSSVTWADNAARVALASGVIATNLASAAQSMAGLQANGGVQPTVQATPGITTSAPIAATVNPAAAGQVGGNINLTLNQTIATDDPAQLARDVLPAIQRELRRNASALRV